MGSNISPGVYTKIIDLSTYVQAVPSTVGFICALTKKGRDNKVYFVGSRSELINEWGEPNISDYGKHFSQGQYFAYNFLGESGSLFFMRCMPNDAAYSNIRINGKMTGTDATCVVSVSYIPNLNSMDEIETNLEQSGDIQPLAILYPIGRGEYYNNISVRFIEQANPLIQDVYVMDIYEKQADGDDVIIESFEVSFNEDAKDSSGESLFITDVLETYSSLLRCTTKLSSGDNAPGYDLIARIYDSNMGKTSVVLTAGSAVISDIKQDFSEWENVSESGNANYCIIAIDSRGNKLYGWLGASSGVDGEVINVFDGRDLDTASQNWIGDTSIFDASGTIIYYIKKSLASVSPAFAGSALPLRKGSDGSLKDSSGNVDTAVAETLLSQGYAGIIDEDVTDTERIYYTMVFDCGYPTSVKQQISTLVQTRRDCVAILDNGDNSTFDNAMSARNNLHTFNNYFCALYESYNKLYDVFTGKDVWFSPGYHMSYLLPRNDNVAEVWYAAAGFNRGAIDTIKELRFNPRLGQRDQMYLKQLNPIVKFNVGYTVWGQLTTQAKPSALQDLNIVRLVLYCKKALEDYSRFYIFEMNDSITWDAVRKDVVQFLEDVQSRRGLYSYSVDVGATDYEKKTKTFHLNVTLQPTRVVEKIELNFFIK